MCDPAAKAEEALGGRRSLLRQGQVERRTPAHVEGGDG